MIDPDLPSPLWKRASAILLALVGLIVYLVQTIHWPVRRLHDVRGSARPLLIVAILGGMLAAPIVHKPAAALLDRLRNLSPFGRRLTTLVVWILASLYLGLTAWHQGRDFTFKIQDEFMYLVQVQAVAHGHLWMPQHPLADFFEEFYVFARPVTSGMYFPGAAIMFAPAVWLHQPFAIWALVICGGVVAMTYRVTAELIDPVAGILAALLMISLTAFRSLSLLTLSYMPMTLLGVTLFWAYLHWRKHRSFGWAAIIGATAGWMAITRPLDAIVFFLPVITLIAWDWLRQQSLPHPLADFGKQGREPDGRCSNRHFALTLLIIALVAAPFLSLQLALDKAVSGHILKTPIQAYQDRFWPGVVGGLHPHMRPGTFKLDTTLPQFRDNYESFVKPHYRGKARTLTEPFSKVLQYALPHYLLFVPLLLSVLGLRDRRRAAFWIILPLFPAAYIAWVMFIKWYAIVIAPVVMFAVVLGGRALVEIFPRWRTFLAPWATASIGALAVISLPELAGPDKPTASIVMTAYNRVSAQIQKPAIVFFRYHPEVPGLWKHEQTYNAETAWFDDASIIRAHDLGPRNAELLTYYAARQPLRTVYLFDQVTMKLTQFGNVADLASHPDTFAAKLAALPTTVPADALTPRPATRPVPTEPRTRRPRASR